MNPSTLFLLAALLLPEALAGNSDPVVLVHGLASSPDNWMYKRTLEKAGLTTYAVSVGKFSSNWDRACEAYAQVRGTVVDYGVCHSRKFNHSRFGRDYTGKGMFPQWDADHKVHLFGHSMGGPTITTLQRILREGSGCEEDTSELFLGGHNWITSMTAFSGVLSGSTIVDLITKAELMQLVKNLIVTAAGLLDNTVIDDLYDIQLDQWGLERESGESFSSFWDRVEASPFVKEENKDIASYDLSIEGVRSANAEGPLAYNDTYYYSFATERTSPKRNCFFFSCGNWYEKADLGMIILLKPFANWIGKDTSHTKAEEQKNDGLVNWINQICPIVEESSRSECHEYDGSSWPMGRWIYQDVNYLDHLQIMTLDPLLDTLRYQYSAKKIFADHAQRIIALPSTSKP
ncbi:Lipase [Diplonema papillatum]|nr:Lipase [Diplonema papillatum]